MKHDGYKIWQSPLSDRISKLVVDSSYRKVIYIADVFNMSTPRYRVYNMVQALDYSNSWRGSYFLSSEIGYIADYLKNVDVIVLSRTLWNLGLYNFIEHAKDLGISIIYDLDDLVFNLDKLELVVNSLNGDLRDEETLKYWLLYISKIYKMIKPADYIMVTTKFLEDQVKTVFEHKDIFVIPNFFNEEQLKISLELIKHKNGIKDKKDKFVIGYFSGTPSHYHDLRVALPAIFELMKRYKDIYLEVVGYVDLPEMFNEFLQIGRVRKNPIMGFLELQKKIADVDLNIIPLIQNDFTNCKSELKYFEASLVKTISCASPTYIYRKIIKDDVNGFLCNSLEWFSKIEQIYKGNYDRKVPDNAYNYVINKYSPKVQSKDIEKILNKISK